MTKNSIKKKRTHICYHHDKGQARVHNSSTFGSKRIKTDAIPPNHTSFSM